MGTTRMLIPPGKEAMVKMTVVSPPSVTHLPLWTCQWRWLELNIANKCVA